MRERGELASVRDRGQNDRDIYRAHLIIGETRQLEVVRHCYYHIYIYIDRASERESESERERARELKESV